MAYECQPGSLHCTKRFPYKEYKSGAFTITDSPQITRHGPLQTSQNIKPDTSMQSSEASLMKYHLSNQRHSRETYPIPKLTSASQNDHSPTKPTNRPSPILERTPSQNLLAAHAERDPPDRPTNADGALEPDACRKLSAPPSPPTPTPTRS